MYGKIRKKVPHADERDRAMFKADFVVAITPCATGLEGRERGGGQGVKIRRSNLLRCAELMQKFMELVVGEEVLIRQSHIRDVVEDPN